MKKHVFLCWLLLSASAAAWPQPVPPGAGEGPTSGLPVLFATNEDAELLINGEASGLLSKTAFRYIRLQPGRYRYTVKSRNTNDEWSDSFRVAANALNEVFVDLLYVVDLKTEERRRLAAAAAAPPNRTTGPAEEKPADEAGQAAVVEALLASLVPVKGGIFRMGNSKSPLPDEREHTVLLNRFLIGRYEVTQRQWQALMGGNPSANANCASCPVENISWEDVDRFLQTLNRISGKKFRLPTEAEWEYVARFGGKTEIDKAGGPEAYIEQTAWHFFDAASKTQPVGLKRANAAGVHDMLGNVAEWCADWYAPGYYRLTNQTENPAGPPDGTEKVVRGGSVKTASGDGFRPSLRNRLAASARSGEVGFRLAMDAE